jgi:ribosomal-protein-serine acetyltransferase
MSAPQPITQFVSLLPIPQRLEGARVLLRNYTDADAQAVYDAIEESRPRLERWTPWVSTVKGMDDRLDYVRRMQANFVAPKTDIVYGIFDKTTGDYLGGCGVHRINWETPCFEIGYWLRDQAQGQGYTTEAARLLTVAMFETLGAARVEIRCDAANEKSANVPRRLGYTQEALLRCERRNPQGELSDGLIFALTWDGWREKLK